MAQIVMKPNTIKPQKFFHIYFIIMHVQQELSESLLSSSTKYIPDRKVSYDGDQDLRRLRRKILPSLPQLQVKLSNTMGDKLWSLPTFNPQSSFIITWQVLNIFLIYIYFIQIPIAIAFGDHRSGNQNFFITINYPVMGIFLLDILVNFNTSFYQDGMLENDPRSIRKNYIMNDLAFDVISLLAILFYEMVEQWDISKNYLKYVILIFFLRIKQLLQIQRIILNSFDLNRRIKATIKLLLLFMKILLICNVVACSGFLLSDYLSDIHAIDDSRQQMCDQSSYWIIATCEADRSLKYVAFPIKYIYSLYWASTTMISIGYGDITPQNSYEIGFTVLMQFLSCLLYGYAINEIWSIIQELNSKKIKIHTRLNTINIYMRDKDIKSDLTDRINGYLTNYYYAKNLRQRDIEAQIIGELTPSLKRQLFFQSYSIVMAHKFFNSFHQDVIIEASQHVKEVCFYEDQPLSESEKIASSCLYYLRKGELRMETGGNAKIKLQTQYTGDHIGLYEFVTQLGYLSTLTAVKYSLAYYLQFRDWKKGLKQQSTCFEYFYLIRERLMVYEQHQKIGYRCHFCTLHTHRTQKCFDQYLREDILRGYEISKKSIDHRRKMYVRRKIRANAKEKKYRKRSLSRQRKLTKQYSEKDQISIFQGLDLSEIPAISAKSISSAKDREVIRGGRIYGKHHHKHQIHKALEKIQKMYLNNDQQSDYNSLSIQIKSGETQIDVNASYEQYYPNYNLTELLPKDQRKRRATRSFF